MIPMASTFSRAMERHSGPHGGAILRFLTRFHENPRNPSHSLERVVNARSADVWSARVNSDLRVILSHWGEHWIALYIDHHDEAYRWAETHYAGQHPVTRNWQIFEIPVVREAPEEPPAPTEPKRLFEGHDDAYLLSLGVPEVWLPVLRRMVGQEELHPVLDQMPIEVGVRLLDLAEGRTVLPPVPLPVKSTLAEQEAATSQLVFVQSDRQLQSILDQPLAKWIAFLHPTQKKLVTFESRGPTKVTGSAGTGKTVVAMHRARHLASLGQRVLLTSFTQTICQNIERNMLLICSEKEISNLMVLHVHKVAMAVLKLTKVKWTPLKEGELAKIITELHPGEACPLDVAQLQVEYETIIEPQRISSWDGYRSAIRIGRGRPLTVKERRAVWTVLEALMERLARERKVTWQGVCGRAAEHLRTLQEGHPQWRYDAVIVDEVQDLKPLELLFLVALAPTQNLFLAGDAGQQIYPGRVSLQSLGIDVRGRSTTLRVNYRTTEQIRQFADQLLEAEGDDLDGGVEDRRGTRSVLRGIDPVCKGFGNRQEQCDYVAEEITRLLQTGRYQAEEIAVFARRSNNLDMLETRLRRSKIRYFNLKSPERLGQPSINLGTMHRGKGLEFKVVFVVDVYEGNVPQSKIIDAAPDEAVRAEILAAERQLLYVSMTRARDLVYLTWAGTPSRFLPQ
jgi:superfamily I DNA/RNA helicase